MGKIRKYINCNFRWFQWKTLHIPEKSVTLDETLL